MSGNLRAVGRPSEYTPEQDVLILTITDSAELIRRLKETGLEARSPGALVARRQYLKRTGVAGPKGSPTEVRLAALNAMRRQLDEELDSLGTRAAAVTAQREAVVEEINLLLDEVRQTL